MGNTEKLEGCREVQWILQLLPTICTRIFHSCSTHHLIFEWGLKEQAPFDELKHLIASEEVTAQPRPIGKFRLEVDASGYALGGVLSQLQVVLSRVYFAYYDRH